MSLSIRMENISKRFGNFDALDHASLAVFDQAVHALVGENGAGKTTLMKILCGQHLPDSGTIEIHGQPTKLSSAADAKALKIGMVSQHYSIIPELTCLDNLMLGSEHGIVLNRKVARERAAELAHQMGFQFEWEQPASILSPAAAQKLEILKLLWKNADLMILDEPTAMLSPSDSDALFGSLRELAQKGKTILVVTHRIPEVLEHCSRVTVLRGGKTVAERQVSELNANQLAELIVGKAIPARQVSAAKTGSAVLTTERVAVLDNRGHRAVNGANLAVREHEIVGLAGVDGNGQRELIRAIMGIDPVAEGTIQLGSRPIQNLPTSVRLVSGISLIAEDRLSEGVIEDWSLLDNASLGLQRTDLVSGSGIMKTEGRKTLASRVAARFGTRYRQLTDTMRTLSGGNQQRFVAGRAMEGAIRCVIAFQPSRGLDVLATEEVYTQLRHLVRNRAAGALVISFDLDELLSQCDRVIVIERGRILEPSKAMDRAEIGRLMVGGV